MLSNARVISMEEGNVYEYRAIFCKTGRAKYISHLDLYRTIQRSFKRAGLPVWHTQGFNPHIYLTFPLPISLGYEGKEESFDFRLCEELDGAEICRRLCDALPEGIIIRQVAAPENKADVIVSGQYTLFLSASGFTGAQLLEKWNDFFAQPEILAEKRSKKGKKMVDLKPMVRSASAEVADDQLKLSLVLAAGLAVNLNPTLLTDAFGQWAGFSPDYHSICREAVLCDDGKVFR